MSYDVHLGMLAGMLFTGLIVFRFTLKARIHW
jgi:hypothetical protein